MKHIIENRNDEVNQRFGVVRDEKGQPIRDKKGERVYLGLECFVLYKIGGVIFDCNTGFKWEEDSDILEVVHTDANGQKCSDFKDMKDYNTTIKDVVADIQYILSSIKYMADNKIKVVG